MAGRIDFSYDTENDVVTARPVWTITTEEDCQLWHRQWSEYLAAFGRKMDCIIVLDDFHVAPEIAATWGVHRAEITTDHLRFHCRVHADWDVRSATLESSARYNIANTQADSVEAALAAIRHARRSAGVVDAPGSSRPPQAE
jgi:hypothetical protein